MKKEWMLLKYAPEVYNISTGSIQAAVANLRKKNIDVSSWYKVNNKEAYINIYYLKKNQEDRHNIYINTQENYYKLLEFYKHNDFIKEASERANISRAGVISFINNSLFIDSYNISLSKLTTTKLIKTFNKIFEEMVKDKSDEKI